MPVTKFNYHKNRFTHLHLYKKPFSVKAPSSKNETKNLQRRIVNAEIFKFCVFLVEKFIINNKQVATQNLFEKGERKYFVQRRLQKAPKKVFQVLTINANSETCECFCGYRILVDSSDKSFFKTKCAVALRYF